MVPEYIFISKDRFPNFSFLRSMVKSEFVFKEVIFLESKKYSRESMVVLFLFTTETLKLSAGVYVFCMFLIVTSNNSEPVAFLLLQLVVKKNNNVLKTRVNNLIKFLNFYARYLLFTNYNNSLIIYSKRL